MVIDGQMRTVIEFRLYRYYFDERREVFLPIETNFVRMKCSDLLEQHKSGIGGDLESILSKYGNNNTEIPDKGIFRTLIDEILSPFYIF